MARYVNWVPATGQKLSIALVARRAAEWLAGHKLFKTDFYGGEGDDEGACAYGAIVKVAGRMDGYLNIEEFHQMEKELIAQLHAMYPALAGVNTLPDLNDHESMTQEGMIAAFEKTALHFEEMA